MKFFISFLFLMLFPSAFAQDLTGSVYLQSTDKPISEAIIIIQDDFKVSDYKGQFTFQNLQAGSYGVTVSCVGFKTKHVQFDFDPNNNSVLTIELEENLFDIPEVTITTNSSTGGMLGSMNRLPSSHYISAKELNQINSIDINKVLFNIPGINLQEEDGFGLRPNIGLRGSGNERSSKITIMEDGILAAPAPYAASSAYYFPTISRMSAIEVEKGSSQIEYGPYTTGGILNLISTPIPESFEGSLRGNLGGFGTKNVLGRVGGKINQWSGLVESFQNYSDGFKQIGSLTENSGFYKQDYLAKLKWETKTNKAIYQSLQAKFGYAKERSNETYLGITQDDFSAHPFDRYLGSQVDQMNTNHEQYVLKHVLKKDNHLVIQTAAYQNKFHRNWYKLDKVGNLNGEFVDISSLLDQPQDYQEQLAYVRGESDSGNGSVLNVKANNRDYVSEGIQTRLNWLPKASEKHQFTLGARLHQDEMDRYQWVDGYSINQGIMDKQIAGTPGSNSNRIDYAKSFSSYLLYQFRNGPWTVDPGLRFEHITVARDDYGADLERLGTPSHRQNTINEWIPGAQLSYLLNEDQQFFSSVHRGFAPPNSQEETKAEESINYELGFRSQKKTAFFSAVAFYNDYQNLLGADNISAGGTGSGDLYNGGAATTYGLEFASQYILQLNSNWYMPFNLSYTYTYSRFDTSFESEFEGWGGSINKGDNIPYIAPNQVNTSVGLRSEVVSLFLRGNYNSRMRVVAGQDKLTDINSIDNRFLLNFDGNYLVNEKLNILVTANNIFNSVYAVSHRPSGLRPGMPRNLTIGFNLNIN